MRTSLLEFISKRMKGLFIKVQSVDKKRLLKCSIVALILLIAGYFCNNLPVFTKEDSRSLSMMEHFNEWLSSECGISKDTVEYEDVLFLNTSYDRELIPQEDKEDEYSGTMDVLNRETLYKFLKILKEGNVNYKYLIIDVDFSNELANHRQVFDSVSGDSVEIEKLLFELVGSMDRVVVALPEGGNLDESLKRKAAHANYKATALVSRFVRYQYFDDIPYVPLKVYNSLQKQKGLDTISCHSLVGDKFLRGFENNPLVLEFLKSLSVCNQGGSLCYNSLFIPFSIGNISDNNNGETEVIGADEIGENYMNLGNLVKERDAINAECEDKYVFIGDMVNTDMHTTYAGRKSGSHIMYKALKELESGKHKVSLGMMLFLFVIYVWMTYRMASKKNIFPIPRLLSKTNNPLVILLADVLTFSLVFSAIHFFEYMGERKLYSFALSILFFTFLKYYMLMKTKSKKTWLSILLAVFAAFCLSFTSSSSNGTQFKVLSKDPIVGVKINGKVPKHGDTFGRGAIMKFESPEARLRVKNIGPDFRDAKTGQTWKHGGIRIMGPKNRKKIFNPWWWFLVKGTISKSGDSFAGHHILAGGWTTFDVDDVATEDTTDDCYYVLRFFDGKHKGDTIRLHNDDEDPVAWLYANSLKKKMDLKDRQVIRFQVEKYNYGTPILITDSCLVEYIK